MNPKFLNLIKLRKPSLQDCHHHHQFQHDDHHHHNQEDNHDDQTERPTDYRLHAMPPISSILTGCLCSQIDSKIVTFGIYWPATDFQNLWSYIHALLLHFLSTSLMSCCDRKQNNWKRIALFIFWNIMPLCCIPSLRGSIFGLYIWNILLLWWLVHSC